MAETYECMDCLRTVELTVHGLCSTCGSNAVISKERLFGWNERGEFRKYVALRMWQFYGRRRIRALSATRETGLVSRGLEPAGVHGSTR